MPGTLIEACTRDGMDSFDPDFWETQTSSGYITTVRKKAAASRLHKSMIDDFKTRSRARPLHGARVKSTFPSSQRPPALRHGGDLTDEILLPTVLSTAVQQ